MTKRLRKPKDKNAAFLPLLEESLCLLKMASPSLWLIYLAGAIPFAVSLVIFSATLWESAFAAQQLGTAALGLTVLFFWLKICQVAFVTGLHARLSPGAAPHQHSFRRMVRRQLVLQSLSLYVLPLSRVLGIPHPFIYSFFQNLTVCEALDSGDAESITERARIYAGLNPRQSILFVLVGLSGLHVLLFLNWAMVLALLPHLIFKLTGWENEFVRSAYAYLHIAFWITAGVLTWLTLDPLVKAFYLLRSYYAASRKNGSDLVDRLRRLSATPLLLLLLLGAAFCPSPAPAALAADDLSRSIEEVAQQRKFIWRLPPDALENNEAPDSGFVKAIADGIQWLFERIEDVADWIADIWSRLFPSHNPRANDSSALLGGLQRGARVLIYLLAAFLAVMLLVLLLRAASRLRKKGPASAPATSSPDLTREEVLASELPADEWLSLVRDLEARGEWKLALRALFLALIARLSDQHLLSITRYKSNLDYEGELARRAHAVPEVLPIYRDLRRSLEAVWFGDHPGSEALLHEHRERIQRVEGLS